MIAPQRSAIFLGSAALLLYIDPLNDSFLWQAIVFVPALVLAAWDVGHPLPTPRATTGES